MILLVRFHSSFQGFQMPTNTSYFDDRTEWQLMIAFLVREGIVFRSYYLPSDSRYPYQIEYTGGY